MEQTLIESKTYRYQVSSEDDQYDTVLYVLHGYGQLAQYFIRKFRPFFGSILVVAPEGMHRFYLKGSSGRVGASWMTKEAREDDIRDNIQWLTALDQKISDEFHPKRRILLGFSQGGATAARWFHHSPIHFDALILWACVFPPDLSAREEIKAGTEHHFVIGSEDEFYSGEQQDALINFYRERGYHTHRFDGKHDIDSTLLDRILSKIKEEESSR